MSGVRRYRDLLAWQLADQFKVEVHRLVETNKSRLISWQYRDQILDSSSAVPKDIAEGFVRYSPAQFVRFLDYALASLVEAEEWLIDGVQRKYLTPSEADLGLSLAKRCWNLTLRLKQSQVRELERRRAAKPRGRRPPSRPPQGGPK